MTISKEAKVGLLGIVAIAILYFGFNFLKGLDFFSSKNEYKANFKDVQGLQVSNPVTFNGVNVGRVMLIENEPSGKGVDVTITIKGDIKIKEDSKLVLGDDGLIGGKIIKLILGNSSKLLAKGSMIPSEIESGLLAATTEKLDPTLKNLDALLINLNTIAQDFDQTGKALKILMASATQTSNGLNGIVATNSKSIKEITTNAADLTKQLSTLTKSLDSQMKPILTKTNTFADSLGTIQLGKTVNNLNTTVASLQSILKDINNGKGTIGQLTSNDSLYINLEHTAGSVNALLTDMKANPKRYVHFSLFGGKKNK